MMNMVDSKLAFVVATKYRPGELGGLLEKLAAQSSFPDLVVIVNASREPVDTVCGEFPSLNVKYIRDERVSASAQRNVGIRAVDADIGLIGFLDDDAVLASGAMGAMSAFWAQATTEVGGAACWA